MKNSKLASAIHYRQKFTPKADKLFEKIVPEKPLGVKNTPLEDEISIQIIGAGSFPSYQSLVNRLKRLNPSLQKMTFTLVEPIKTETDFFLENFADSTHDFIIYNGNLKNFLTEHADKQFDIIFFEHPETMTLPILLSRMGMSSFKRVTSFREAIPMLGAVIKANTLIIGSCMTRHELKQLQALLNFSFKIKPDRVASSLLHIFYGGPYSEGLCYHIKQPEICSKIQQNKTTMIRLSDHLLFFVLLLALIIYIFYCSQFSDEAHAFERLAAILLMGAQLHLHRPGISGIAIKLTLLATQMALF